MRRRTSQPTLGAARVAEFAGLLAEPSRVEIVLALIDGRAWTGVELARRTGLSAATISEHLTTLVDAGFLAQERAGRHRYVRLASAEIATFVEDLVALAGEPSEPASSLRAVRAAAELAAARTCYDHLAGRLGVGLLDTLIQRGDIDDTRGLAVTPPGRERLSTLLGEELFAQRQRRPLVRPCLDWTERRTHLGGRLGMTLLDTALDRGWVERGQRARVVLVTPDGRQAFQEWFGLTVR